MDYFLLFYNKKPFEKEFLSGERDSDLLFLFPMYQYITTISVF